MRSQKSHKNYRHRPYIRNLLIILVLGIIGVAAYGVYLDNIVSREFEGKRFALPATVYARPLELFKGSSTTIANITNELDLLAYTRTSAAPATGQYRSVGASIAIGLRPFSFWDAEQPSRKVALTVRKGKIDKLHELHTNQPINLIRIDPVKIGGIYPGSGEDRELVRLQNVPETLLEALLIVEDQRFYQHIGVDPKGILRALTTVVNGGRMHGGSTITQQLVKNFFLSPERTITRKLNEMLMALVLERRYEKNDILETYLNEVYFGQDKNRAIHGVGLAAKFYFGLSIEQLKTQHCAMLVALLKGPAYYNPRRHPKRALERRNLVIRELDKFQLISSAEAQRALKAPLGVITKSNLGQSEHPAFMALLMQQLKRDYREEDLRSEGLRIFSTLDPIKQRTIEHHAAAKLTALEKTHKVPANTLETAVIVTNVHSAEVVGLVGGRHRGYAGFNRALKAKRPIGSLMKPVIYITALERPSKYSLLTPLQDTPIVWQDPNTGVTWEPRNFDKTPHGEVPMWFALAKSYNLAATHLGLELGVEQVIDKAKTLGIEGNIKPYPSSLLGAVEWSPLEVTQLYQSFASGGFYSPLRTIRHVTAMDGTALQRYKLRVRPVSSPEANYLLNVALQQVVKHGTARTLQRYVPSSMGTAGKTGTSDDLRDSWFVGYNGMYLATVWVGNDQNQSIRLTGSQAALPLWGSIIADFSDNKSLTLIEPKDMGFVHTNTDNGSILKGCDSGVKIPFLRVEGSDNSTNDFNKHLLGLDCSKKSKPKGFKRWIKSLFD